jgi:hypothetical protein
MHQELVNTVRNCNLCAQPRSNERTVHGGIDQHALAGRSMSGADISVVQVLADEGASIRLAAAV